MPPGNCLKATSFLKPDERKRKVGVVAGGESTRHVDGSRLAPDVGVPLIDQFSPLPDLPIVHEAEMSEEAGRRMEDEGTEADEKSETIFVGGPLSNVDGWESDFITFEEAVWRAGLISETETALDTPGLPVCQLLVFSLNINFLLKFHSGQLFHPLS